MKNRRTWQLHEAKARFSELSRRVRTEGPQRVVKQHGEAVVVVAAEDYDRGTEVARQPESLVDFFKSAAGGQKLDLTRKRDKTRTLKWWRRRRGPASRERQLARLRRLRTQSRP